MPDGKQPYFISTASGGVLSIAGLWDRVAQQRHREV